MFVYTLGLKVNTSTRQKLDRRFRQARTVYNLILKEILRRDKALKGDPRYKQAYELEKGKERNTILKELDTSYELLGKYTGGKIGIQVYNQQNLNGYIPADTAVQLGMRAWNAYSKMKFAQGARRVNYADEITNLLTGKPSTGIRIKDGELWYGNSTGQHKDKLIQIPVSFRNDAYEEEVFRNKLKYTQLVRERVNGVWYYRAQLIFDGFPPVLDKDKGPTGNVGLDIGTSTLASTSFYHAEIDEFATSVDRKKLEKKVARLQRLLDREKRAANPDHFNEDGTIRPGKKRWVYSAQYKRELTRLKEIQRKAATARKLEHQALARKILRQGDYFVVETMNWKSLTARAKETVINEETGRARSKKRFGATIGHRAPGLFIQILKSRAEALGKTVLECNTQKVKASQLDHSTGEYKKVSLDTRAKMVDNHPVQRDLYSAFLLQHVKEDGETVDLEACKADFPRFLELQEMAMSTLETDRSSAGARQFERLSEAVTDGESVAETVSEVDVVL